MQIRNQLLVSEFVLTHNNAVAVFGAEKQTTVHLKLRTVLNPLNDVDTQENKWSPAYFISSIQHLLEGTTKRDFINSLRDIFQEFKS